MSGFLGRLLAGGLSATAQGVARGIATFTGDKVQRESNTHDEQMAVFAQMAAEYSARQNRTWWDSFVDGLNRLPRPLMALSALGVLAWAPMDPISFSAAMQAYSLVPEWLALVLAQIILLFAGGRMLEKWNGRMKGPSAAEVAATLKSIQDIQSLRHNTTRIDEATYQAEMADEAKPLSLPAILEWNRRRQAQKTP